MFARDIERIVVARAGSSTPLGAGREAVERPVDAVAAEAMTVVVPAGGVATVGTAPAVGVSAQPAVGVSARPAVAPQPTAGRGRSSKGSSSASWSALNRKIALASVAALVFIALGVGALVVRSRVIAQSNRTQTAVALAASPAKASIRVRTTPPGGSITVDGQAQGTSDVQLALDAGDHQIEAALVG